MKIRLIKTLMIFLLFAQTNVAQQDSIKLGDTLKTKIENNDIKENVFDYDHSKKFAEYLFKTGQYDYAIEEYQRTIFLNPFDQEAKYKIVKSYIKKEDFSNAAGYFHRFFPAFDTLPVSFQRTGIVIHLFLGEYDTTEQLLSKSALDSTEYQTWKLGVYLLKKDWPVAKKFYDKHQNNPSVIFHQFGTALNRRLEAKTKSPFVAGALSTMVPGLGKVYTKNYGDAAIAFLFTGLNAWQAYRGFQKDGVKSVRGWIFAGLGGSFYLGNIYGSVKAAKRYNKKIDDEIESEVKSVIKFSM
jgi:tetratricopeptide (TPR) repeat protein